MPEITPSKYLVSAGWQDVPHLSEAAKAKELRETPRHLRDARSKGIPSLGAGAIYPIPEEQIKVDPFAIPPHWPRCYSLDVGWNWTAALWCAWDLDTLTKYLYAEYKAGEEVPPIHAAAIKGRGEWIPGLVDPAANGRAQKDGEQLKITYEQLGLNLTNADNSLHSGLWKCEMDLSVGRTKVFSTLQQFFAEYRLYRRDEKGRIVKKNDHLMDDMRYIHNSGRDIAITKPALLNAAFIPTHVEDSRHGAY